ncbi:MAG: hypothetical protein ACK5V4_04425, partial [Alphaproteobacteria bacterium]
MTDFSSFNDAKYEKVLDDINGFFSKKSNLKDLGQKLAKLKGKNATNPAQMDNEECIEVFNGILDILKGLLSNESLSDYWSATDQEISAYCKIKMQKHLSVLMPTTPFPEDENGLKHLHRQKICKEFHPDRNLKMSNEQKEAYSSWTSIYTVYDKKQKQDDGFINYFILRKTIDKVRADNNSKLFWWRFNTCGVAAINLSLSLFANGVIYVNVSNFHRYIYLPLLLLSYLNVYSIWQSSLQYCISAYSTLKKSEQYRESSWHISKDVLTYACSIYNCATNNQSSIELIIMLGLLYAVNGAAGVTEQLPMQLVAMTALSVPSLMFRCVSNLESKESLPKFLHGVYDFHHYAKQ